MKLCTLIASLAICSLAINPTILAAQSPQVLSGAQDTLPELKAGQGYLLINIDVGGIAPSFEYRSIRRKRAADPRGGTVYLKDKEPGFYLTPMTVGTYQVSRVNAPYYNLPFWVDTTSSPVWGFRIEEAAVNYFGRLEISNMRGLKTVFVDRKNRIAGDIEVIEEEFESVLAQYPLRIYNSYRDDFYSELQLVSSQGSATRKNPSQGIK